ncbi:RNA polymerase sigma factor [Tropicimonas isoalkanivorans]|uniref:RNA polymerase sigma-70 factor, ECF subfamily n=1 Tax=Tropicimonas isoalkanivorans TaxID=441112 RepID=A0A1I1ICN7_9RHOB|nr:RNA polymerase sigma factor [Tropicimonas isoalkanivorans]SFC33875.1 RNA polymerase sigma-70 factor, ECF subfamily [Tropicimonas isoalkanivorans]
MSPPKPDSAAIQDLYRREGRRVFATLVRLLGSFDLAEEALQNAFVAAAERWPREGMPKNPVAWLISAGRFQAIDQLRRQRRMTPWSEAAGHIDAIPDGAPALDEREAVEDDRLRLIFTCCHPSFGDEASIALTLREVCGLSTEAIAHACLLAPTTLAQRIVRAKAKIRDAGIPYEVPDASELPERLGRVLRVLYLVFNEGYSASSGDDLLKPDLSAEAIRLARLLADLLPEPEVRGLLALLLLQESRRRARTDAAGDLVPLEEQDRSLWDRAAIVEGCALVGPALQSGRFGSYTLQAAIAAVHAGAPSTAETDWAEIAGLYGALLRLEPSPVVALNRAVAVAMAEGPEAGLALVEPLMEAGGLGRYHLAHAAKADLLRRLGRLEEAKTSYETALGLSRQAAERRFLERRLAEIDR